MGGGRGGEGTGGRVYEYFLFIYLFLFVPVVVVCQVCPVQSSSPNDVQSSVARGALRRRDDAPQNCRDGSFLKHAVWFPNLPGVLRGIFFSSRYSRDAIFLSRAAQGTR